MPSATIRTLAILVLAAGAILVVAGESVDGPLTAYSQANTIEKHATEAADGKTYAELDQDDPRRETVMTASFLRASLFTSVVSFGVAAMAAGLGVVLLIVGWALLLVARALSLVSGPGSGQPTTA